MDKESLVMKDFTELERLQFENLKLKRQLEALENEKATYWKVIFDVYVLWSYMRLIIFWIVTHSCSP